MNTRCIYYRVRQSRTDADNLALCPILDFANHSKGESHIFPVINAETKFEHDRKMGGDFVFLSGSDRSIEPGEELFLRYGSHPNHKLFVEYGFVNPFDENDIRTGQHSGEITVQDIVEKLLNELGAQATWTRNTLENEGYWG